MGFLSCSNKQMSPIYAGPLALALIRGKLEEHGLLRNAKLYEINHNTGLTFKNLKATFFRTTHSIPEPLGIVIPTPQGKNRLYG